MIYPWCCHTREVLSFITTGAGWCFGDWFEGGYAVGVASWYIAAQSVSAFQADGG